MENNTLSGTPQSGGPSLSRQQRRAAAHELTDTVRRVRQQLGYVPTADELTALADAMKANGVLPDDAHCQWLAEGWPAHEDERFRLAAYAKLIDLTAPALIGSAMDALAHLHGDGGRIELASLSPSAAGRKAIGGSPAGNTERLRRWLGERIGRENLYVGRDPRKANWSGSSAAQARDVEASTYVAFDFDRKKGEDDGAWAARRDDLIRRMEPLNPRLIVDSGNGLHVWFRVERTADRAAMEARAKLFNDFSAAIGADRTHDLPRIMRLPGTINIPDKGKRDKGRVLGLARTLHTAEGKTWTADELADAVRLAFDLTAQDADAVQGKATDGDAVQPSATFHDPAPSEDALRTVLARIPNRGQQFEDRNGLWMKMAHAVWGASSGEPWGRDCWLEWCATWEHGGDPDANAAAFDGIRTARVGYGWLRELARQFDPHADALEDFEGEPIDVEAVEVARASAATIPRSIKDKAVAELLAAGARPIHTTDRRSFLVMEGRAFDLAGDDRKDVLAWLARRGQVLNKNARADLFDHLEALAFGGPAEDVAVRRALVSTAAGPAVYLDLVTDDGAVVEITSSGWKVILGQDAPVNFWRPNGAKPLPIPKHDGQPGSFLDRLSGHINLPAIVKANDQMDAGVQARAAVLMLLTAGVIPLGAVPHCYITGPQGAAKTSTGRTLKALLDPASAMATIGSGDDPRDVLAVARASVFTIWDNVSRLADGLSDVLCAVSTGGAIAKRKLYTDGDTTSIQAKSSFILTGIEPDLLRRADLADRTVILHVSAVAKRRTEADLMEAWMAEHPALLALWLDAVAGALARLPALRVSVNPDLLPRLADAALAAEAVAQAMGWPADLLFKAVGAQRQQQVNDLLDSDPLVHRLTRVCQQRGGLFLDTSTALLAEVQRTAGPAWGSGGGPTSARGMAAAVSRLAGPLMQRGWIVDWGPHLRDPKTGARRMKIQMPAAGAEQDAHKAREDGDHPF